MRIGQQGFRRTIQRTRDTWRNQGPLSVHLNSNDIFTFVHWFSFVVPTVLTCFTYGFKQVKQKFSLTLMRHVSDFSVSCNIWCRLQQSCLKVNPRPAVWAEPSWSKPSSKETFTLCLSVPNSQGGGGKSLPSSKVRKNPSAAVVQILTTDEHES